MLNNEYVEYWGSGYVVTGALDEGITFRVFFEKPGGRLRTVERSSAPESRVGGFRPLLPRQWRVAQRLWQRWEREPN